MPEGDTIHLAARRLRDALAQRRVVRVEIRRDPRGLRPPAPGTVVTDVHARGKHLLIDFDDGSTLHTHMQMTGAWHVYAPGARWRRANHRARVIIERDDGTTAVCFDAPIVELRRGEARRPPSRAQRALTQLGPDLTEPDADVGAVVANVARLDPATELGAALLDQRVGAGIGNVVKSEACWAEQLSPFAPVGDLDEPTLRRVYTTAHRFLVESVARGRRVTYGNSVAVYRRARRPCPRCRAAIQMRRQGDPPRSTYFCPRCQALRQDDVDA
jgi:endonuclease VIII